MKRKYHHIWGQGIVNLNTKDSATLKIEKCLENMNVKAGNVLEIGCGAGRFIRTIKAYSPNLNCYGCDIDKNSIKLAGSFDDNVFYTVSDAISLPYEKNCFDTIILFDIVEHIKDTQTFFDEIKRIGKQGAKIHIYVPCEGEPFTLHWLLWKLKIFHDVKKKHAGHIKRFTKKGIISMLQDKMFAIDHIFYSTYIIGQIIDYTYYMLQEFKFLKVKLQKAHGNKDERTESSFIERLLKRIIQITFLINYRESNLIQTSAFAHGIHITCTNT